MAKKPKKTDADSQRDLLQTVKHHYDIGFEITEQRETGRNIVGRISFKEADELFRSWIDENNWPYDAILFDPRIFTFIFEKTSRLISNKPKGVVTPREGSDLLKARLNNELLSYQWDMASNGGAMIAKWAQMDMNARKYGAAFALCPWRYETADGGKKVLFDGPDMKVLNNRNCAPDPTATSIEDCNWFQLRQFSTLQDLKNVNDAGRGEKPVYENLKELEAAVGSDDTVNAGGDRRSQFSSRDREIAGITEDPYGQDPAYKTIELVTEYRKDRWITFAYKHGIMLRDIENPAKNNQIPITMLRYYSVDDDIYGISEIEPVKGLQKAINALLCQYIDEINQNLYSPIAIGPGVKQHTLEWGKGARWMMNNPQTDFRIVQTNSDAAQYFNNTYSALVAAMMNALGESSLGVSNVQPFQTDKTATEVKELTQQRNSRDQFNQIFLAEAIKRQYKLWHSMNQALLFSDEDSKNYVFRIVGRDTMKFMQEQGLGDQELPDESVMLMYENEELGKDASAKDHMIPKYGVNIGDEKEPNIVPKMSVDENGTGASIYLEPDDILGQYDFYIDVESMAVNNDEQRKQAQETAITMLTSNPNVVALLASENVKPKFKNLFITWLEDLGIQGAERYFEDMPAQGMPGEPSQGMPGESPLGADSPLGGRQGRPISPAGAKPEEDINQQALSSAVNEVMGPKGGQNG